MSVPLHGTGSLRTLRALGIDELEEHAYRWLLEGAGATVPELAQALQIPLRTAESLLDAIEAKALATCSPEHPRRYIPTAPNIAMETLINQRRRELLDAEAAVRELQERVDTARRRADPDQMIELITSQGAERHIYEQMHRGAVEEVVTLVRMPIRISRLDMPLEEGREIQRGALRRGVRYRSIVDPSFLEMPNNVGRVRNDIKAGEQVRVLPSLPIKMVLVDRSMALLPLRLEQANSPSLLVRSSALLDVLYAMFESLWERATQISIVKDDVQVADYSVATAIPANARDLLMLLAAGLNDKSIAHESGISASTLQRRITDLMKLFDSRSRFQLGWAAALHISRVGCTTEADD